MKEPRHDRNGRILANIQLKFLTVIGVHIRIINVSRYQLSYESLTPLHGISNFENPHFGVDQNDYGKAELDFAQAERLGAKPE